MNFAPLGGSSAEFCLLSSAKLWFKEKLEAFTTQWTAKKKNRNSNFKGK